MLSFFLSKEMVNCSTDYGRADFFMSTRPRPWLSSYCVPHWPGCLLDDELPRAFRRQGVERVFSRRYFHAADVEIDFSVQRRGFIGARTPYFSIRRKFLPNFPALEKGRL